MEDRHGYPIVIISGAPGSGKTGLARELCNRFNYGVHLETDALRMLVVKGFVPPLPPSDEAQRQFFLMAKNAAMIADNYASAGFFVVIDDVISSPHHYQQQLHHTMIFKLFLKPALHVTIRRNESRQNKDFDPRVLNTFIAEFFGRTQGEEFSSQWDAIIDTSEMSVAAAADRVLTLMQAKFGLLQF